MIRDDFIKVVNRIAMMRNIVMAYKEENSTSYLYEMFVDDDNKRTQIVNVFLSDDNATVFAISKIGDAPNDSSTLTALLEENRDGFYSRLFIYDNSLYQGYRYKLEELENREFIGAIDEVAHYADFIENKYYGGVDNC